MALPAYDNFNTAEAPLVTNWGYATGSTAQFRAVSNILTNYNSGEAVGYWKSDSFNNDQYSKINTGSLYLTNWIADFGPTVRCATGALTFYFFLVYSNTVCRMYKKIAGSWTQLGSDYSVTVGNSVPIKLSVSGTTLTPNVNGSDLATQTDSAITSGYAGIRINQPDTYSNQLDNWEGGNLSIQPTVTLGTTPTATTGTTPTATLGG